MTSSAIGLLEIVSSRQCGEAISLHVECLPASYFCLCLTQAFRRTASSPCMVVKRAVWLDSRWRTGKKKVVDISDRTTS